MPLRSPLKINPGAISLSREQLPNDYVSTVLDEKIYTSRITSLPIPNTSLILSSGVRAFCPPSLLKSVFISKLLP